ncbi:Alkaline phosphatase synthesis sensor protein PhoR [bioreactor metagenome]|uniref:histidine kinase n=1 Tax=bioreactor metagenome TaxID=1076179 RepID=A0A645BWQ0_9ZZZZ
MSDGAILVDGDGTVSLINPAARHLFKFFDSLKSGQFTLIEICRQHEVIDLWENCRSSGQQKSITIETPSDREYIQVIGTDLSRLLPGATLLLFQNLTTMRKLETVRRDFVSNVSHELRTPLASLKALTETLQSGALNDPPAAERFLSQMDEEIDNLTQMVQELLELSKIESGKVPLLKKTIVPIELVYPAIKRMELQAERAKIELINQCAEDLPLIEADPARMQQVLVNLLHNAIKFTPPNGQITVAAEEKEKYVIFSVKDTGVGIPEEDLDRIFERFYKADRARSSGGTGLGLSISRHLIEAHQGKIWVESVQGKGSTFFFSLPIKR